MAVKLITLAVSLCILLQGIVLHVVVDVRHICFVIGCDILL